MAFTETLPGNYCSTDAQIPWDQRVDLDVIYEQQGCDKDGIWTLRYNDRKYAEAPTTRIEIDEHSENSTASFKDATFLHWITRKTVATSGTFEIGDDGSVSLQLTQVGQGMTALETWSTTLGKKSPEDAEGPKIKSTKLLGLMSDFSAPNSVPTKPHIDALAISKNGDVVLEKYFAGMAADTLHIISSCTKSIMALLAGIAIEQKLFGLDDKIADHFPGVNTTWSGGEGKPPVLVRHVLSMTAGTGHTVKDAQDLLETTDAEQLVLGWDLVAAPGARYNYDNGLPSLIGCVIERTSGVPLVDFANQHLFGPMGIACVTWTDMPTPTDRPYVSDPPVLASGGMGLALPDFLKLGQMLLQNGQYDGRQIIPEAYLAEATRQQTQNEDYPYGYYFHINQRDNTAGPTIEWIHLDGIDGYFMLGQGEQILFIAPKEQIVVAAFSSTWHRDRDARTDKYAIMDVIKFTLEGIL